MAEQEQVNTYAAFYRARETQVSGPGMTALQARRAAAQEFRVRPGQEFRVSVTLAAKDGEPVTHVPLF